MEENVEKANQIFTKILEDNCISLNEEYKCNFKAKYFIDEYELNTFKFKLNCGSKSSPVLSCKFNEMFVMFADKETTLDKYDQDAILDKLSPFNLENTYNVKLIPEFLTMIGYEVVPKKRRTRKNETKEDSSSN